MLTLQLGEIDRARAVYSHASQFCDPNVKKDFWETWNTFEVRHGNEDTYRDMLRSVYRACTIPHALMPPLQYPPQCRRIVQHVGQYPGHNGCGKEPG